MRAVSGVSTYLLGPTPRYLTGKCCENPDHLVNFKEKNFTAMLSDNVRGLGRHLRSLVWHRQLSSIKVLNTGELMGLGNIGNMTEDEAALVTGDVLELWGTDPVHPTPEAYSNLGAAIMLQAAPTPTKSNKRKAGEDPEPKEPHPRSERRSYLQEAASGSGGSGRDYSPDYSERDYSRPGSSSSSRQGRDYSPEHQERGHSRYADPDRRSDRGYPRRDGGGGYGYGRADRDRGGTYHYGRGRGPNRRGKRFNLD